MVVLCDTSSPTGHGAGRERREAANFRFCPSKAFTSEDVNERNCRDLDFR